MPSRYQSVDFLRFLAALLVVFAHRPKTGNILLHAWFGSAIFSGSIGVDLFFIISGLVIFENAKSMPDGISGARYFISRRLIRILPLYWILTFLAFGPLNWDRSYFLHSILFIPDSAHSFNPAISVGWTLQFEMFFYLIVALGILLKQKSAFTISAVIVSALACHFSGFYLGAPVIFEFLMGVGLALLVEFYPAITTGVNKLTALTLLTFSVFVFLVASTGHDSTTSTFRKTAISRMNIQYGSHLLIRPIAWGIPATFVVAAFLLSERHLRWRGSYLGSYTYSIYLWQGFPVPLLSNLTTRATLLGSFAFAVQLGVVSYLSFQLIEKPYLTWGKSMVNR